MATGQLFGLSIAVGVSLVAAVFMFSYMTKSLGFGGTPLQWIGLPLFGYGIAVGLNAVIQKLSCGAIRPGQIAFVSGLIPLAIVSFLVLTLSRFVRSPIVDAIPLAYRLSYGNIFALAFYMFWAGMFGEAVAGGLIQGCPK